MKALKNLFFAIASLTFTVILFACSENSMQEKDITNNPKGPDYTPMTYPNDRLYTEDHVWVKLESESVALIGITTYPLSQIGTVMAVQDPIDETLEGKTGIPKKKKIAEIIGSLSNFGLLMPVYGDIVVKNPDMDINPSIINIDPYNLGWIYKISNFNLLEVQNLMNAGDYEIYVAGL